MVGISGDYSHLKLNGFQKSSQTVRKTSGQTDIRMTKNGSIFGGGVGFCNL